MVQLVVGAIIVDSLTTPTRVLAARRTAPALLAGKWEFPGGKVEPREEPVAALERELQEELSITGLVVGNLLPGPGGAGVWPIDDRYELALYFCTAAGEVAPAEDHDAVRWLGPGELGEVDWLPSDLQAIPAVRARLDGAGTSAG